MNGIESSRIRARAPKVAKPEQTGSQLALSIDPTTLTAVFGVDDSDVAAHLLAQLVNVIHAGPGKPVDAATINQALALVEGICPSDTLEAMTATMLVGAQHAALDALRRAQHPDQTPAGRALYGTLALKAMRTYAQLIEALNHGRGKGVTQQIIVKHVTVEPGGQAVVGSVKVDRGRG